MLCRPVHQRPTSHLPERHLPERHHPEPHRARLPHAAPLRRALASHVSFAPLVRLVGLVALTLVATPAHAQFSFTELSPVGPMAPFQIITEDFDGDSHLDLLTVSGAVVTLLTGDGTGAFTSTATVTTSVTFGQIGAGDLTNDGLPDFVISDYSSSRVDIYINDALGSFALSGSITISNPSGVAIRDVDGDDNADIVVGSSQGFSGGNVELFLGDGTGAAVPGATIAVANNPRQFIFDDFDLDGTEDILAVCTGLVPGPAGGLYTLLGDGFGGFTPAGSVLGYFINAATGDFNGDTIPDVVVGQNNDIACLFFSEVRLGTGTGSFGPAMGGEFGLCGPPTHATADFDADGNIDYLRSGGALFGPALNQILIHPGLGTGAFETAQTLPTAPNPQPVAVADFDANGAPDFALGTDAGITVFLNDLGGPSAPEFIRGDTSGDGAVQINDPIALLNALFVPGTPPLPCDDTADVDDDGQVIISDVVYLLSHLFIAGSPPPAAPFPDCGEDPNPDALAPCVYPTSICP